MDLAIFDFDETITNKNTFTDFLFYSLDYTTLIEGFLTLFPAFIKNGLQLKADYKAGIKQVIFYYFYSGYTLDKFNSLVSKFIEERLPKILKPDMLEKLEWHKQQGHKVMIISGTFELLIKDWCENKNIELIGTGVEVKENIITGNFSTTYCQGQEKVNRLKEKYDLNNFETIYMYSNSSTADKPLFDIADKKINV